MKKNSKINVWIETELYQKLKKQAEDEGTNLSQICRRRLMENPPLIKIENMISELSKKINYSIKSKTGGKKMVKELPNYKGYTVDERLRQIRKVDREKPSIEFIDFDSAEGQEILEGYYDTESEENLEEE